MAISEQKTGTITVKGITYTLGTKSGSGTKFNPVVAIKGKTSSEGASPGSITLNTTKTYTIRKKASGSTVTHPYLVHDGYNDIAWFTDEIFPNAVYTLTIKPNGGQAYNGSTTTSSNFTTKVAYDIPTYIGNLYKKDGTNYYITDNTPIRTGYTFKGWTASKGSAYRNTSGGTFYFNALATHASHKDSWVYDGGTNTGAVSVTAQWRANTYTVSFNSQEGSSVSSKTVTFGSTYGTLSTPTRTGYSFDGWYTAASGGTKITSSSTVSTAGNHTLYAHWTASQMYVCYDFWGSTGLTCNSSTYQLSPTYQRVQSKGTTDEEIVYQYGPLNRVSGTHTVKTPSTFGVSKTGYHLKYYEFTAYDNSGKAYKTTQCYPGSSYTMGNLNPFYNSSKSYFSADDSCWEPNICTVHLSIPTGATGVSEVYVKYNTGWYSDSAATSPTSYVSPPVRSGYTFKGYWTGTSGSGTRIIEPDGYINPGYLTYFSGSDSYLYAHWQADYIIKYNLNGGSRNRFPTQQTIVDKKGALYGVYENDPSYFQYSFKGWGTSSGTTTVSYYPEVEYPNIGSRTLYAIWSEATEISMRTSLNQSKSYSVYFTNQTQYYYITPSRKADFVFTTTSNDLDPDFELYDSAGSSLGKDRNSGEVNYTHTLYPDQTYYIRLSNYKSPRTASTSSTSVVSSTISVNVQSIPYYTVSFDAGGYGVSNPPDKEVQLYSTYGTLPEVSRPGYTFLGWFTYSGEQITETTDVKGQDITLVAHWDPLGLVEIYYGGKWKKAVPYIYNGSEWQRALTYINENGTISSWELGTNYGQNKLIE